MANGCVGRGDDLHARQVGIAVGRGLGLVRECYGSGAAGDGRGQALVGIGQCRCGVDVLRIDACADGASALREIARAQFVRRVDTAVGGRGISETDGICA